MSSRHLSKPTIIFLWICGSLTFLTFLNLSPNGQYLKGWAGSFDILQSSPRLFPYEIDSDITTYQEYNEREIQKLQRCLDEGECHRNQEKVVLAFADAWSGAVIDGWRGGEGVWAMSMFRGMRELGYTVLLGMNVWDETLRYYRMFPDQVKVIIKSAWINNCIEDPACIKSEVNPTGIPRWKSEFSMHFFPDTHTRFGLDYKWIIHADRHHYGEEETEALQYIGYSLEDECMKHPFVPHHNRPLAAWTLAKQASLFHLGDKETVFNKSYFELASKEPDLEGLSFRGAYQVNGEYMKGWIHDTPVQALNGVVNLGKIGPDQFLDELANSRILIGVGNPPLSPSPYVALCMGTPFLNPIKKWDEDNPEDRSKWVSQHNYLKWLDPPYVYNVPAHSYSQFISAISQAIQNPPPRYVDPPMTIENVRRRVERLVESDWRELAREYMEERIKEGEKYTWTL
ncbi:hypothetical protein I302_107162 [Kwoniella bestiolae CBS 10118]|uniref:Glycosyltransferase family 18 catalytic domain-containing protein n=1 Tax=Kwoniella bestiolae CBS 10118 TaxID=1296100 RepID=A0AAJ8MBS6_9TREE